MKTSEINENSSDPESINYNSEKTYYEILGIPREENQLYNYAKTIITEFKRQFDESSLKPELCVQLKNVINRYETELAEYEHTKNYDDLMKLVIIFRKTLLFRSGRQVEHQYEARMLSILFDTQKRNEYNQQIDNNAKLEELAEEVKDIPIINEIIEPSITSETAVSQDDKTYSDERRERKVQRIFDKIGDRGIGAVTIKNSSNIDKILDNIWNELNPTIQGNWQVYINPIRRKLVEVNIPDNEHPEIEKKVPVFRYGNLGMYLDNSKKDILLYDIVGIKREKEPEQFFIVRSPFYEERRKMTRREIKRARKRGIRIYTPAEDSKVTPNSKHEKYTDRVLKRIKRKIEYLRDDKKHEAFAFRLIPKLRHSTIKVQKQILSDKNIDAANKDNSYFLGTLFQEEWYEDFEKSVKVCEFAKINPGKVVFAGEGENPVAEVSGIEDVFRIIRSMNRKRNIRRYRNEEFIKKDFVDSLKIIRKNDEFTDR